VLAVPEPPEIRLYKIVVFWDVKHSTGKDDSDEATAPFCCLIMEAAMCCPEPVSSTVTFHKTAALVYTQYNKSQNVEFKSENSRNTFVRLYIFCVCVSVSTYGQMLGALYTLQLGPYS
jgi:hypothetical protein